MAYDRKCSTYWCDECGAECSMDWHNSGDIYFVLRCTGQCPWSKVYIALSDVVARRVRQQHLRARNEIANRGAEAYRRMVRRERMRSGLPR
jgi:hypothetical protein